MRAKLLDLVQVVGLDRLGVDLDRLVGLVVLEPQHPFERKQGLGLVEDVEDDEVVAGESQAMEGLQDRLGVAQQVAEEHDQAAVPEHAGDLVQARLDLGRPGRLELGQERQDVAELRPLAPRRQALADLLVEGDQAHRDLAGGSSGSREPPPG